MMSKPTYYNPAIDMEIPREGLEAEEFQEKNFFRYKYAKENFGDQAFKVPPGTWSPIRTIIAAYINDHLYYINLSRGSFPALTVKELKSKFIFYL